LWLVALPLRVSRRRSVGMSNGIMGSALAIKY